MINSNQSLIQAVETAIRESGYKKIWIAEQAGMSRQALNQLLQKQNFSLDDANKILLIIGYMTETVIKPVNKK